MGLKLALRRFRGDHKTFDAKKLRQLSLEWETFMKINGTVRHLGDDEILRRLCRRANW